MFEMTKLYQLMELGWNIQIECKGKGREYEMTFEATANRILSDEMTAKEKAYCLFSSAHAVGNNLDELLANLEKQMVG